LAFSFIYMKSLGYRYHLIIVWDIAKTKERHVRPYPELVDQIVRHYYSDEPLLVLLWIGPTPVPANSQRR